MRILLAAEGPSDEVVCEHLIRRLVPEATVSKKRFPSRGFPVVRRLVSDVARAAHYGFFDALVVHFDLNHTLPAGFLELRQSPRWQEIQSVIDATLDGLRPIGRTNRLATSLITPCQSTDAWLAWGVENNDGPAWEQRSRHELKPRLFGLPPRGLVKKSESFVEDLKRQMNGKEQWPLSLRHSVDSLRSSLLDDAV